ncbi:MAG: type II toxin-antitoxin system RelE/ParE family toxin [Cyanobacteria bacterium SBLK]|nr:type II toxin-antitoxin system RelE/ParE family toxin [Cyanobacteria bacterium SBLK]
MSRLVITVGASQDLEEISDYFLEKSLDAGDRFVEEFNKKCGYIARFPHLGKSYSQLLSGLRGISLMNYIIFYRILEDRIEILRVVSGYRHLPDVFKN